MQRELGIAVDSLFINRVLPEDKKLAGRKVKATNCKRCHRAQQWQLATLQGLQKKYGRHHIYLVEEFPGEIAGAGKLKKFTSGLWQVAEQS